MNRLQVVLSGFRVRCLFVLLYVCLVVCVSLHVCVDMTVMSYV